MEPEKLLDGLVDKKVVSILKVFIKKKDQKFTLKEMSKASRVNMASTHRILKRLKEQDIIAEERIKYLKMYSLSDTRKTRILQDIFEQKGSILSEFIDCISQDLHIKAIILDSALEREKANLLVVLIKNLGSDDCFKLRNKRNELIPNSLMLRTDCKYAPPIFSIFFYYIKRK